MDGEFIFQEVDIHIENNQTFCTVHYIYFLINLINKILQVLDVKILDKDYILFENEINLLLEPKTIYG